MGGENRGEWKRHSWAVAIYVTKLTETFTILAISISQLGWCKIEKTMLDPLFSFLVIICVQHKNNIHVYTALIKSAEKGCHVIGGQLDIKATIWIKWHPKMCGNAANINQKHCLLNNFFEAMHITWFDMQKTSAKTPSVAFLPINIVTQCNCRLLWAKLQFNLIYPVLRDNF